MFLSKETGEKGGLKLGKAPDIRRLTRRTFNSLGLWKTIKGRGISLKNFETKNLKTSNTRKGIGNMGELNEILGKKLKCGRGGSPGFL